MPTDSLRRLIDTLISRTQKGDIKWNITDNEYAFILVTENGGVSVDSVDRDGRRPFRLRLYNDDAAIIDTMQDDEYPHLAELYEAARASARDIDTFVDRFLSGL